MAKKRKARISLEQNSTEGRHIPFDLLLNDLLYRCPAKSLLRFRCVSQQWRRAISDPEFVQKHLTHSTLSDRRMLLVKGTLDKQHNTSCYFTLDYQTHDNDSDDGENAIHFSVQKFGFPWTRRVVRFSKVIGSCNGLILSAISVGKQLALWNPSTRTYREFNCSYDRSDCLLTGFCYDSSIDDYMVIFGEAGGYDHTSLIILSIRTGAWERIRNQPYTAADSEPRGVNLNGVSHWIMWRSDRNSLVLVWYDFKSKRLRKLALPNTSCLRRKKVHLSVLRGCLCLYGYGAEGLVIWMMKKYLVRKSWTYLSPISNLPNVPFGFCPKPLFFTNKGEIIVSVSKNELVIYNPMKKTHVICNINLPDASIEHVEAVFVESFVVPPIAA